MTANEKGRNGGDRPTLGTSRNPKHSASKDSATANEVGELIVAFGMPISLRLEARSAGHWIGDSLAYWLDGDTASARLSLLRALGAMERRSGIDRRRCAVEAIAC